jgi:GalNAc-alpha-(1->4)-GalNAc-alpha-(1->3)-diNAcBac-PP-undecaprenol alpha-1,4-N-acetyl-D-galactosaminyltransferase
MANLFVSMKHKVTIAVLDENTNSYYRLSDEIQIFSIPLHFGITSAGSTLTRKYAFVKHIFRLRKLVKQVKPDIVISTDYPFSIALVLGNLHRYAKLITWEPHHFYWLTKNKFWKVLFNRTYPKIDSVVCLNEREKKIFDLLGCRTTVIPSLIPKFPIAHAPLSTKQLLTVGWFIKRKGIDLIPAIAEIVFKKHPDWKWVLVGDGEEKETFQSTITRKNLANNFIILLPVPHQELEKIYVNASIYVLTSLSEAFPAVLIESMASGVPAVSFDCLTGPSDIIKDREDGVLVEEGNVSKMADAICMLIEQEDLRRKMGAKAAINMKRYSNDAIYSLWSNLFEKL